MAVILSLFLFLALPWIAYAADNPTIPAPPTKPIIVQLSIDPPVRGVEPKCTEDGMIHLRGGVLKICTEGTWQPVVFSQ